MMTFALMTATMVLASAAPLAANDTAIGHTSAQKEIVVTARERLKNWHGKIGKKSGKCRTRKSSGDAEVDTIACRVLETCWNQVKPKYDALVASKPPRSQRRALIKPLEDEFNDCGTALYEIELERLDARRDAERE
jgi:hypothetical protein